MYVRSPAADADTPAHLAMLRFRIAASAAAQGGLTVFVLFHGLPPKSGPIHAERRPWLAREGWVRLRSTADMLPTVSSPRGIWRPQEVWARRWAGNRSVELRGAGGEGEYLVFLRTRCCFQWGRKEGGDNGYRRCEGGAPGDAPFCNEMPFGRRPNGCRLGRWRPCEPSDAWGPFSEWGEAGHRQRHAPVTGQPTEVGGPGLAEKSLVAWLRQRKEPSAAFGNEACAVGKGNGSTVQGMNNTYSVVSPQGLHALCDAWNATRVGGSLVGSGWELSRVNVIVEQFARDMQARLTHPVDGAWAVSRDTGAWCLAL
eukprot:Hpha_TRINITY_DN7089_c0_g1::TRINITY_DN7089_c0_g1_i1::g.22985::m.22985